MRCLVALVACLLFFGLVQGQPDNKTPGDTTSIRDLLALSKGSQWIDSYQSLNYADEALLLAQEINDRKGIAMANNLKGFCFWSFGDNDLAIQSAMEALQALGEKRDPRIEAESYYILARGYMDVRETAKAHEAIAKAETLAEQGGNWEQLCSIHNLKGVVLFIDGKIDSALILYNKAFEVGKNHSVDPINFARIVSNIGECYADENPALAMSYYNKALGLAKETNNKIAEASITAIIGHAHLEAKDLRNAETNLQGALQLAQKLGLRRVIRHAYQGLVDIRLQQGNGNEAVVYLRRFYAVRDSLLNGSKIRQIVELEARHELQLKEQNIRLLESQAKLQSLWNRVLVAMIVFLILSAVGVYLLQQYRHRKNRAMLNLEIDYLTQQHKEAVSKYNTLSVPESNENIESYDQKLLKRAIAFVDAHISDPQLSVEKMADALNMSRTSLHRKIKSITGFPPSELIRSIRLRKAARLILSKADTASQIAIQVGFDDYSHFSKAFKKHFGVAPTSYEEQTRLQKELEEPVK